MLSSNATSYLSCICINSAICFSCNVFFIEREAIYIESFLRDIFCVECYIGESLKEEKMGCSASMYAVGKRKKTCIPEVVVYVPSMRIPAQSDLQRPLRGLILQDLVDRLACLRNQIVLVAEDTGLLFLTILLIVFH